MDTRCGVSVRGRDGAGSPVPVPAGRTSGIVIGADRDAGIGASGRPACGPVDGVLGRAGGTCPCGPVEGCGIGPSCGITIGCEDCRGTGIGTELRRCPGTAGGVDARADAGIGDGVVRAGCDVDARAGCGLYGGEPDRAACGIRSCGCSERDPSRAPSGRIRVLIFLCCEYWPGRSGGPSGSAPAA
jgi:hypothetical protein